MKFVGDITGHIYSISRSIYIYIYTFKVALEIQFSATCFLSTFIMSLRSVHTPQLGGETEAAAKVEFNEELKDEEGE